VKTNGATWKAYLASWPQDQWFDDSDESVAGMELDGDDPADDATVTFTCGVVYATRMDQEGVSLVSHFRKWQRSLSVTTVVVEVPRAKLDELKAWLKTNGGKTVT